MKDLSCKSVTNFQKGYGGCQMYFSNKVESENNIYFSNMTLYTLICDHIKTFNCSQQNQSATTNFESLFCSLNLSQGYAYCEFRISEFPTKR